MVFGYNATEEIKEVGTELKGSRNQIIIGLISFISGALIAPRIEKYFNKEEYEEEDEQ